MGDQGDEQGLHAEASGQVASTPPTPRRRPTWLRIINVLLVLCFTAAIGCFDLWLFTRNNGFPLAYHPDEGGKVRQVISGSRNYHHPQLLLETTELWLKVRPVPIDEQQIVIAGRQVSALFAAVTAACLALTCYLCAGWWGFLFGTILMALAPPLVTFSHYMKEDAALVVGLAVAILASRLIWVCRRWWLRPPCWMLLACGCALATSGKYVGAMSLFLPAVMIFFAPRFRWFKPPLRLALVLVVFGFCFGLLNHRTLDPDLRFSTAQALWERPAEWRDLLFNRGFLRGYDTEFEHGTTEHWGLTAKVPHNYMLPTAIAFTWPQAPIAAMLLPLVILLTRRQSWGWETLLVLFAIACALVLAFSKILFPRYTLPLMVFLHLMAALAIGRSIVALKPRPVLQATLGIWAAIALLAAVGPVCLDYTAQFAQDNRDALHDWAVEKLPRNARVYTDSYCDLVSSRQARPDLRIQIQFLVPYLGTLESLSSDGEVYVAICDLAYGRFREPRNIDAPGSEAINAQCRAFYNELLQEHTPIWSATPRRPMGGFTNPAIRVYKIKKAR